MTDPQTPATETIDQRAARMQRERRERFLSGQPASAFAAHRADPQTPATNRIHKPVPSPRDPAHCRKCGRAWWAIIHQKYVRLSV